ncbi:hypothetical protein Tco_1562574 [Tanacetum coccineum]
MAEIGCNWARIGPSKSSQSLSIAHKWAVLWATVKAKTINGKVQLQVLVYGKKIIITKLIVRRDLQLEYAEGIDCLPNATIFEQLTLMGYEKVSQKLTFYKAFFSPQWKFLIHTDLQCLRRPKRKDTEIPQPSGHTDNVADEAVNEEMDDSLVRAATTASSLEAEQDSGNIIKTQSKATPNEVGSQGTTSGGGPRVLDLEKTKTTQAQKIISLKLRVKKLEKKGGLRTHKLKRLYKVGRSARMISSDDASLGDQEDASKQGRKINDIDKDAEITLVDETQGRYGDDLMFDTSVLDDEEVFAGQDMAEKENNVAEKEVSTADPVTIASKVVTTASVEISIASPTETTIADDLTLA